VSQLVMQKMSTTQMEGLQARIMMLMPLVFTIILAWAPSGLVLYWFANNILSMGQQILTTRILDRREARAVRAVAVQQQTVSVRILHVGGAGRGVEPAGRSAVIAKPLAQGGPAQRAPRRAAQPFAKRGWPYRNGNEPASFVECDDVAVQSVGGGEAPGRERRGVHPGRGGEDGTVMRAPARGRRESVQVGSECLVHMVAAQTVDHDVDYTPFDRSAGAATHSEVQKKRTSVSWM